MKHTQVVTCTMHVVFAYHAILQARDRLLLELVLPSKCWQHILSSMSYILLTVFTFCTSKLLHSRVNSESQLAGKLKRLVLLLSLQCLGVKGVKLVLDTEYDDMHCCFES